MIKISGGVAHLSGGFPSHLLTIVRFAAVHLATRTRRISHCQPVDNREPENYRVSMPKLRHYDNLNTARFVTFCCYRRNKLLTQPQVIETFLQALEAMQIQHKIRLFGYVIMPEHVHLVLHPPDSVKLGPVIGALKSKSASAIIAEKMVSLPDSCWISKNGIQRRAFWQPRCYDHNCRSQETVIEKINYCHNNPVKLGLAPEARQWRWSSYGYYTGEANIPLAMDALEPSGVL